MAMNLYQKIVAIMSEVSYVQKDDTVSFKSTNYKALSEEKVTELMHAQLVKHGLVVFPISTQYTCRDGGISHVDEIYRLVNADAPEEYIDISSCGDGYDSQDKGPGKAMTYSYKYMWRHAFAIPTGEDPDKVSSEEITEQKAKQQICPHCGKPITARGKYTAQFIADRSQKAYGAALCWDCSQLMKGEQQA